MSSAPTPAELPFRRATVVGLGVMGGSLARALTGGSISMRVTGWSPDGSERAAAVEAGAVHSAPERLADAVAGADLVVLAAPVDATCKLLRELPGDLGAETVVTDVGSMKATVAQAAEEAGLAGRWVGSHPMVGSEQQGFAASRADLYRGARVWLVPGAPEPTRRVSAFWTSLGAEVSVTDAKTHDRLMAQVSHLPQLVSSALATVLAERGVATGDLGPGGRDVTRLAASNPAMWRDILRHAPAELSTGLRDVAGAAERLADLVERGDLDALQSIMEGTRRWRSEG